MYGLFSVVLFLQQFHHPSVSSLHRGQFIWNLANVPLLEQYVDALGQNEYREVVEWVIQQFKEKVTPKISSFRPCECLIPVSCWSLFQETGFADKEPGPLPRLAQSLNTVFHSPACRHQPRGPQRPQHPGGSRLSARGGPAVPRVGRAGLQRHELRPLRVRGGHRHHVHDGGERRAAPRGRPRPGGLRERGAADGRGAGGAVPAGERPLRAVARHGGPHGAAVPGERGVPHDHGQDGVEAPDGHVRAGPGGGGEDVV